MTNYEKIKNMPTVKELAAYLYSNDEFDGLTGCIRTGAFDLKDVEEWLESRAE